MPEGELSLDEVKKQCVFCHIVAGRVASKKVYEDSKVAALLDINPANPGHVLLLPKEHHAIMPQISDDDIGFVGMSAKAVSSALLRALKCHGTTLFIANGVAAGQRAQHFMVHIIPRMDGDGLSIELPERKIGVDKLNEIKNLLLPSVKKVLGKSAEPVVVKADAGVNDKKEDASKTAVKPASNVDLDDIARLFSK